MCVPFFATHPAFARGMCGTCAKLAKACAGHVPKMKANSVTNEVRAIYKSRRGARKWRQEQEQEQEQQQQQQQQARHAPYITSAAELGGGARNETAQRDKRGARHIQITSWSSEVATTTTATSPTTTPTTASTVYAIYNWRRRARWWSRSCWKEKVARRRTLTLSQTHFQPPLTTTTTTTTRQPMLELAGRRRRLNKLMWCPFSDFARRQPHYPSGTCRAHAFRVPKPPESTQARPAKVPQRTPGKDHHGIG